MLPGGSSHRVPPSWGPEDRKSFKKWSGEILRWCIVTDLDQPRQAAAVSLQLRGSAAEFVEQMPAQALIQGGMLNGQMVDPMTFLMGHLSQRFAPLQEELRATSMNDLLHFTRHRGESIDNMLIRFDGVVQLAQSNGRLAMPYEGYSMILLKACGVTDQQFLDLLQPFGGRESANIQEFTQLKRPSQANGTYIGEDAWQYRIAVAQGYAQFVLLK